MFGWTIRGPFIPDQGQPHRAVTHENIPTVVDSTEKLLTRFWETEEPPSQELPLTPEEGQVQIHYDRTHLFLPHAGRYQVSLLKKADAPPLGESRSQAVQRYTANEKALLIKGTWKAFQDVVQEYLDLVHAQPISAPSLTNPPTMYYLLMHGIVKDSSTTTKLRVVFDASAKTTSHTPLNNNLLVGPTLHLPLTTILLRFRAHLVAVSADISRMYRVVELAPEDRDLHRFVWRHTPDTPIQDFWMTRVTFGVSASLSCCEDPPADCLRLWPGTTPSGKLPCS